MKKSELISYIDEYLNIRWFHDWSKNGLQVDTDKEEVFKLWFAVDASNYIFDKAIENNVDILFVHHWLFWWFDPVITGLHYERVKRLLRSNMALYGVHLPLDAHPEVWNNIGIIRSFVDYFKITDYKLEEFWEYHEEVIWFAIRFENPIASEAIGWYCQNEWFEDIFYNFSWKETIKSVCVVSGWGWSWFLEASKKKFDLFLTWEAAHFEVMSAKEIGQSIVLGWHYNTETAWVRLLAEHLKEKFSLETVFIDEKY